MNWRVLAIAIVFIQLAAVAAIGAAVGYRYSIPVFGYWSAALGIAIIGTGLYSLVALAGIARRREAEPAKALIALVLRCDLPLVAFLVGTQLALLGWLKVMMPYTVGFWADPLLADADALLFGGEDPWKLLHQLPIGGAIDRIYLTWGPACAAVALALAFAPSDRRKSQCIVAYFLTVASASLGQYLLPSAGPVFYEAVGQGSRFADMPVLPWVRTTADYLWVTYTSPGFRVGSGISAWPSLHVAGAMWMALCGRCYFPKLQAIGWAYWAAIMVGSVYLGWHYALDGIAGSLFAYGVFVAAGVMVRARTVPQAPALAPALR
jgi:hypothetical protein